MVSIGLLMVSVTSATALAEERSQGSLDVLMATPLATRDIVLGKWRGAYRIVPRLAILPGVLALGTALGRESWTAAVAFAALIAALVLAYGAVVTSLGLALATWQPRLGRAVGLSVSAYLTLAVIYPTIALMTVRAFSPRCTRRPVRRARDPNPRQPTGLLPLLAEAGRCGTRAGRRAGARCQAGGRRLPRVR